MKSFKSYLKEYGALDPFQPMGGNSSGPGMGQYVPSVDLNLRAQKKKNPRIPRKKGQPAGSDKHSDLYTDENPKGTIHGLGFKDVETARASVKKIEGSGKKHAHKIQAAIAMEQRAKEMGKTAEAAIYRAYIEKMKKKTKEMQKEDFTQREAKDHKKDYETFAQLYKKINKAVDDANVVLKKLTKNARGTMGMIDPRVKSSSKYKIAKANYDKVDALRKRFLKGVPKDFMKKFGKQRNEDFLITEKFGVIANQTKLSELIFRGSHKAKEGKEVDNMYIPMSSALFKRVFPKQVRVRTFHVTSPDGFERLYDIQNSTKSISTFANMSSRNISGGIAEGSGVVAEIDGNALVSSSQDLFSVPIKDGRRLISYGWLRGKWGERNLDKIDKDMAVLLKALIRKYAPERTKNRTSPYFTDFEVWKSVRASYEWHKNEPDKKVQKAAGKKMQKIIKDYLDGVERVLKKNAKQVQHILTNYLKTRRTEDNWDEIIVDDVNILKVFIISDHEETAIFKKDQLDHEAYKKMLDYTKLPVKIVNSVEMERYVLGVAEKELKKMMEERNYKKEYANYQGKPEQIARRSSRNKARRLMGDKDIKGKDIGHKDNNPLNNDPKNLKIEDPSKNRREPRLRGQSVVERLKQSDVEGLEKFADRLLKKYKIDIEFTKHFVDRLNDPRNEPEIKVAELQRLFKKIKKNKGIGILSSPDIEAVLKDMETNLNLPVVIKKKGNEFEVTNKTIMRKPNFKTTSKVIRYENAPDTSDAMKRYKAGKAGFTDIAHLKAKGLIARSDGEKKKSAKYK